MAFPTRSSVNFSFKNKITKFIRIILENDSYGLQRWEIGEIANKIAQLYYNY